MQFASFTVIVESKAFDVNGDHLGEGRYRNRNGRIRVTLAMIAFEPIQACESLLGEEAIQAINQRDSLAAQSVGGREKEGRGMREGIKGGRERK